MVKINSLSSRTTNFLMQKTKYSILKETVDHKLKIFDWVLDEKIEHFFARTVCFIVKKQNW